jgi:hypothetical protein
MVRINPDPVPVIQALGATEFCPGDSVELDAGDYAGYEWSNGASIRRIMVRDSGSYSVTVIDSIGCRGSSAPITVRFHPLPTPVIDGPSSVCIDGVAQYTVSSVAGDSYQWRVSAGGTIVSGQGTSQITVRWSQAGIETVDLEQTSATTGCHGSAGEYTVNVGTTLTPKITAGGSTMLCEGDSVLLSVPGGYESYIWSTGETTRQITVHKAGTYGVTVTGAGGCSGSDSISVIIRQLPQPFIDPEGPITLCAGDSVVLTAASGYRNYLWSNGQTTQRITVRSAGGYSVSAANEDGCRGSSEVVEVFVNPAPPKPIVTVDGSVLTSTPASGYQWYLEDQPIAGATAQNYTSTQSGHYHVTITDSNGCRATSEVVGLFEASARISLGEYEAVPGERLRIPLMLEGTPDLEKVGAYGYRTRVRFFKALLYPTGSTLLGVEQGADRVVTIEGRRAAGMLDGEIGVLEVIAALGDTLETALHIEGFEWIDGNAEVTTRDGLVRIRPEGGWNRYRSDGKLRLQPVVPNPAVDRMEVVYETIEPGARQLYIADAIGRHVQVLVDGEGEPEQRVLSVDVGGLASGVYFLVLQTPTGRLVQPMQVEH